MVSIYLGTSRQIMRSKLSWLQQKNASAFLRAPPYSINLTPCKHYLSSKLKEIVFVKRILTQKMASFTLLRVYIQITVQLRNCTT